MDLPINTIHTAIMKFGQATEIIALEDRIYKMSQHPLNQEEMVHVINPSTELGYTIQQIQLAIKNAAERAPFDVAISLSYNTTSLGENPTFEVSPILDHPTSVGEHPEEEQPVFMITADSNIFPVGGGQFCIGYDSEWDNFGDDSHNSCDFRFNTTDPNHLNCHLGLDIFGPTGAPILKSIANGPIQSGILVCTLGSSGAYSEPDLHYSAFKDVPSNTYKGEIYRSQYTVGPSDAFQYATDSEGNENLRFSFQLNSTLILSNNLSMLFIRNKFNYNF